MYKSNNIFFSEWTTILPSSNLRFRQIRTAFQISIFTFVCPFKFPLSFVPVLSFPNIPSLFSLRNSNRLKVFFNKTDRKSFFNQTRSNAIKCFSPLYLRRLPLTPLPHPHRPCLTLTALVSPTMQK